MRKRKNYSSRYIHFYHTNCYRFIIVNHVTWFGSISIQILYFLDFSLLRVVQSRPYLDSLTWSHLSQYGVSRLGTMKILAIQLAALSAVSSQ